MGVKNDINAMRIYVKDEGTHYSSHNLEDILQELGGGGGGTFITLTDCPSSYSGAAGRVVAVNSGATGLEFNSSIIIGASQITVSKNILFSIVDGQIQGVYGNMNSQGGNITIRGGASTSEEALNMGSGGKIILYGANASSQGNVLIESCSVSSPNNVGTVEIRGGNTSPDGGPRGGFVLIHGGDTFGGELPGDVTIRGGIDNDGTTIGKNVVIYGGSGGTVGYVLIGHNGSASLGNVGIGMIPTCKLDITGTMRINGNITFSSSLTTAYIKPESKVGSGVNLDISSGASSTGGSGNLWIKTGTPTGAGDAGSIYLEPASGIDKVGGNVVLQAGGSSGGSPGYIQISGGAGTAEAGGNVIIYGGSGGSYPGGNIFIFGGSGSLGGNIILAYSGGVHGKVGIGNQSPTYFCDVSGIINTTEHYRVDGVQVVSNQQTFIADPTGGTTVDSEGRAVTASILDLLAAHGLMAAS